MEGEKNALDGRAVPRLGLMILILIKTMGMKNAQEPSIHTTAPTSAWSSRADIPKTRGAVAYVGYTTRSQKIRKADKAVF